MMFIQEDPRIKNKQRLANSLMASAVGPTRNSWEGLGQLAKVLSGAYIGKTAADQETERRAKANETLSDAMGAYSSGVEKPLSPGEMGPGQKITGMNALAQVMSTNPDLAPFSAQLQLKDFGRQQGIQDQIAAEDRREQASIRQEGRALENSKDLSDYKQHLKDTGQADSPAAVREWNHFKGLSTEDQERYLTMKRSNSTVNLGDRVDVLNPLGGVAESHEKGVSPDQRPELKGEQEAAKESRKQEEKARGEWKANETKLISSIGSMKDKNKVISDSISQVKGLLSSLSAEYGALFSAIPASESNRVKNLLDTIKANIGFAALQEMRDNSPTGGALGQVSEMENRLLQSVWGSLEQTNDMGDMITVLDRINSQRASSLERMEYAYGLDKERYGSSFPDTALEDVPTMKEETTDVQSLVDKYAPK